MGNPVASSDDESEVDESSSVAGVGDEDSGSHSVDGLSGVTPDSVNPHHDVEKTLIRDVFSEESPPLPDEGVVSGSAQFEGSEGEFDLLGEEGAANSSDIPITE